MKKPEGPDLDAPYDITAIRTYASWDSGRDGQQYTVSYTTALDPSTYTTLLAISRFDVMDFPLREDYDWETGDPIMVPDEGFATTLVQLKPTSGFLARQKVSLQLEFNGVENGGTAYREIQVTPSSKSPPTCSTWARLRKAFTPQIRQIAITDLMASSRSATRRSARAELRLADRCGTAIDRTILRPVSSSCTISLVPPARVATTGSPNTITSIVTRPKGSPRSFELSTKASAAR
jgi:hypothetical protein